MLMKVRVPLILLAALLCMTLAVSRLETGRQAQGKQQLEQALLKACVACYAAEGCYPPSLEHLQTYYGVQINTEVFTVKYEVFASNLMPEITVLVN